MSQTENIENCNGLILKTNYIPEELLIQILSYVDCAQLVLCHLVCKQWNNIIKTNVWRKKAEIACSEVLYLDDKTPWNTYLSICNKKPFNRNFLTSTDVEVSYYQDKDNFEAIQINVNDSNPPINILPFPDDPLFERNINCIRIVNSSYGKVERKFVVDLIKEGCTEYILDNLQPAIKISEWYYTQHTEEKPEYDCSIKLLSGMPIEENTNRVVRVLHFNRIMHSGRRGKWFKFTSFFKNYGPGVRLIKFYDGGYKNIIMAGASVSITVPSKKNASA